jgi:tryptophanyl-tRNA synthetase
VPGARKRVLSGMRPTGRLHIGNYFGALQNWVKLQNDPQNECFYFIADWHSLTSDYADTSAIAENTVQVAIDFLAGGLDPAKSTIFLQSLVPEHAELNLLLSMVTPLGWLERVPTYKEALANIKDKDLHTYGFLGYPVLQCGDIVMYGEEGLPLFVPVGEDQVSHVELSREIVRRFGGIYNKPDWAKVSDERARAFVIRQLGLGLLIAAKTPAEAGEASELMSPDQIKKMNPEQLRNLIERDVHRLTIDQKVSILKNENMPILEILQEPAAMLTTTPRIPGTDGRKMSKSYGNDISLSESDESIRAKTKVMITDPARKRRENPGNPDICPVYDWHKLFSPQETLTWAAHGCRTAEIGCIECKAAMADNLIKWITPVRARRQGYEKHPQEVLRVLDEGSKKARKVAQQTMARVREAVFGWEKKRAEIAGTKPGAKNVKVGK